MNNYVAGVHGGRDNYEPQICLYENNLLHSLVVEANPDLINSLKKINGTHNGITRSSRIPKNFIKTSGRAFSREIFGKLKKNFLKIDDYYGWLTTAKYIGLSSGYISKSIGGNLFMELYSAYWAFNTDDNKDSNKVLFQTHPFSPELRSIYKKYGYSGKKYCEIYPLSSEVELGSNDEFKLALDMAAQMATKIICTSKFTYNSLARNGIDESKIITVPYGVDSNLFYVDGKKSADEFNLLFVGQSSERKGLDRLIDSWIKLNLSNATLTLIGGDIKYNKQVNSTCCIKSLGRVSDSELRKQMSQSDALILPSIAEGFGLVILQSLACGTPVIATENSALPDIVASSGIGKIIPMESIINLPDYIIWAYNNKDGLNKSNNLCIEIAKKYSWNKFRDGLLKAF
jgi:glycosyltransferase involved in cell wall biosynthesis